MQRRHVALLRAITNVPMQPFREALEDLGLTGVESYGASGNLLFSSDRDDRLALEHAIAAKLGAVTMVRTRAELKAILDRDPFGREILFLKRVPTPARRRAFLELDFESAAPVLRGKTVYFAQPARLAGRLAPFDFERALGVQGTVRTARAVRRLLARM